MSQENVEIVRRATEGFNDSGVESLLAYCDPSVKWHTTGEFPDSGVYEGRESVRRAYKEMEADLDRVRYEIEEIRGAGDWVVVTGRMTGSGTHRRSAVRAATGLRYSPAQGQVRGGPSVRGPDRRIPGSGPRGVGDVAGERGDR